MTINELINELKPLVTYRNGKHYMGSTILTNKEMHTILNITVGAEYNELTNSQKTKVRQRVFKECLNETERST